MVVPLYIACLGSLSSLPSCLMAIPDIPIGFESFISLSDPGIGMSKICATSCIGR